MIYRVEKYSLLGSGHEGSRFFTTKREALASVKAIVAEGYLLVDNLFKVSLKHQQTVCMTEHPTPHGKAEIVALLNEVGIHPDNG